MLILALLRLIIINPWVVEVILRQGLHYKEKISIVSALKKMASQGFLVLHTVDEYAQMPPATPIAASQHPGS